VVESRTKTTLDEARIEALARHAFGDVVLRAAQELTDGYFNTAYRVELDPLGPLVLKVAPPTEVPVLTYERDLMRGEAEAMGLVAADPEVPAPGVRFADFTRARLPVPYLFMDLVEGRSWSSLRGGFEREQNDAVEAGLGRISAALARVEHPTFGYLATGPAFDDWFEAFGWMCRTLYADARRFGLDLPLPAAGLERLLERHRGAFEEITVPRLVHWDLWAGNVFVSTAERLPRVTGVIDFERALWGDPLMEFIPGRLHDVAAYEAGFGRPLLATREQRVRRLFYNLYLGLVLIVEDGPRAYTDKSTVDWGRGLLGRAVSMLEHGDVLEDLLEYA
jgi:aminoglycoside phosphotransferase (APT) family kinase protein